MKNIPADLDRLTPRQRPDGRPIMHQDWGKLLFMHWRIEESALRPLIPAGLEIDTFDGSAWIGIVPFTMWNIQPLPPFLPRLPGLSSMHELNVRTYVHYQNFPGVWFFSLDCESAAAVLAARALYFLPYYHAEMRLEQEDKTIDYSSVRTEEPKAAFAANWTIGDPLPASPPDSLEFFLTERYCLFSEKNGKLFRSRIHHQPWTLQIATVSRLETTQLESLNLTMPQDEPLLHYAEEISVDIWPLKAVS